MLVGLDMEQRTELEKGKKRYWKCLALQHLAIVTLKLFIRVGKIGKAVES
jgi:hypothetical protein